MDKIKIIENHYYKVNKVHNRNNVYYYKLISNGTQMGYYMIKCGDFKEVMEDNQNILRIITNDEECTENDNDYVLDFMVDILTEDINKDIIKNDIKKIITNIISTIDDDTITLKNKKVDSYLLLKKDYHIEINCIYGISITYNNNNNINKEYFDNVPIDMFITQLVENINDKTKIYFNI